ALLYCSCIRAATILDEGRDRAGNEGAAGGPGVPTASARQAARSSDGRPLACAPLARGAPGARALRLRPGRALALPPAPAPFHRRDRRSPLGADHLARRATAADRAGQLRRAAPRLPHRRLPVALRPAPRPAPP